MSGRHRGLPLRLAIGNCLQFLLKFSIIPTHATKNSQILKFLINNMFWEKLLHFQRGGLLVTQKPRAVPWAVSCCPFGAPLDARCCSGRPFCYPPFGGAGGGSLPLRLGVSYIPFVRADAGCSHRPERPSATSPGQRPGLYDARGSPPCKGKSFCTYSAKNPTATQKPRAMPWAVSCCPFGASLGVRCCSGRHRGLPLRLGMSYVPSVQYVFSISHLPRMSNKMT